MSMLRSLVQSALGAASPTLARKRWFRSHLTEPGASELYNSFQRYCSTYSHGRSEPYPRETLVLLKVWAVWCFGAEVCADNADLHRLLPARTYVDTDHNQTIVYPDLFNAMARATRELTQTEWPKLLTKRQAAEFVENQMRRRQEQEIQSTRPKRRKSMARRKPHTIQQSVQAFTSMAGEQWSVDQPLSQQHSPTLAGQPGLFQRLDALEPTEAGGVEGLACCRLHNPPDLPEPGHCLLLLPDQRFWASYDIIPLPSTSEFLRDLRRTLPAIPFSPTNVVELDEAFQSLHLSDEDRDCLVILTPLLIREVMDGNSLSTPRLVDAISRVLRRPYFCVEGGRRGCCSIEGCLSDLPATSLAEARRTAEFLGEYWMLKGGFNT